MPKVSVIVPNYNHARFLPRRLDSILCQTFSDFEIIVLDDASVDNSREIINRYLPNPRIRFYANERNSGSTFVQWNRGLELAQGEFLWIAESDDYAEPTFLETLLPVIRSNPELGLVYCQSWKVDSTDRVEGSNLEWTNDLDSRRWLASFHNWGRDECARFLLWKNTIPNASAVLLRRAAFVRAGGAACDMRLAGDWMTWVRILLVSDIAYVPEKLNYYRWHPATIRNTTPRGQCLAEAWRIQKFILQSCGVAASAPREVRRQVLNEFMTSVRSAPHGERWLEFRRGFRTFGAMAALNPLISTRLVLNRAYDFFKRISAKPINQSRKPVDF